MSSEADEERDDTELGGLSVGGFVDDPAEQARSRASVHQGLFGGTARPLHLGRYVVLGTIGAGGMGVVYRAYDPQLDRKVALKLVHVDASAPRRHRARVRLLREGQAMARLAHPNVVPVFDSGTHGEDVFVAMEYVDGVTLREWLRERPRRWREILAVCLDAARGLAAAHHAKLLHRDFKPGNVLIGRDGRARVLDFGLARALEQRDASSDDGDVALARSPAQLGEGLTELGAVVGTPAYMAPERLAGAAGDERSDQYSFAVALYEALAGRHPFAPLPGQGPALVDGLAPRPLPSRITGVPRWLDRLIARALAAAPEHRHADMDALIAALGDDPWLRVRRGLIALLCVLLVAGLGRELWAWTRPGELRLLPSWAGRPLAIDRLVIDERELPDADAPSIELEPGLHHLRAYADGFRTAEAIVEVARGVAVELPLAFEHEEGTLDIEVEPPGATIVIDGIEHGSPLRGHRIATGVHQAQVRQVGSYQRALALEVRANETTRAFLALPPGLVWSEPETGVNADLLWLGDVDGDGLPDVAHRNFNEVTAFDPWHGERLWSVSFGALQGERTVWGELDGDGVSDLVALHRGLGRASLAMWSSRMRGVEPPPRWSQPGDRAAAESPAPAPVVIDADDDGDADVITFGLHDAAIEAFDGRTGARLWRVAGDGTPLGLAAVRDAAGVHVLALDDRLLRAVVLAHGRPSLDYAVPSPWRAQATPDTGENVAPAARALVHALPGGDGLAAAVRTRTGVALFDAHGEQRWHVEAQSCSLFDADADGEAELLLARSTDVALLQRDGSERWRHPRDGWLGTVVLDGAPRVVTRTPGTIELARAGDLAPVLSVIVELDGAAAPFALDWDGDGHDELALTHAHGVVAFDRVGERVASVYLEVRPSAIASSIDADGDGISDLLLESNGPQLVAGPRILWRRRATDAIRGGAIVRDFDGDARLELAVFAGFGGPNRLQLLDAETGIIEAAASTGADSSIRAPTALRTDRGHDVLHVVDGRPTRYAGTGAARTRLGERRGNGYASAMLADLDADGALELGWVDWTGELSVWDAESFALRFTHRVPAGSWAAPLVLDQHGDVQLVLSLLDGSLIALSHDGARELWRVALGARNAHAPLVLARADDGRPVLVTTAGAGAERRDLPQDLVGIAAGDGRELWRWPGQGWARSRAAELDVDRDGDSELIYGTRSGAIVARSPDGTEHWRDQPERESDVSTALVVADLDHDGRAELIAGYDDGRVRVLDASSGRRLWSFAAGDEIEAPPLAVDVDGDGIAEIVVGSHDRFLYCLRHVRPASGPRGDGRPW